jgi:DNA-directed RNA polymerase II subunit RPB7
LKKALIKMFYTLQLKKELEIPPRFFGSRLKEEIERRLRQEVEGTCSGQTGFVIAVLGLDDQQGISKGLIREGVGNAVFRVGYTCMVFMPHKGEVTDAVVKSVNKVCGFLGNRWVVWPADPRFFYQSLVA